MMPVQTRPILLTFTDGSVAVMRLVLNDGRPDGVIQTDTDAIIQREISRTSFDKTVASWRRVTEADIPQDRTFRNAWRDRPNGVEVDMPAAREIHRNRLRAQRVPLLEALDVEYQRADEDGDQAKKRDVANRKKVLRDAPSDPRIDAAKTPDELKAITLEA